MKRIVLVSCLSVLALGGCFVSHTKERESSEVRTRSDRDRACGREVCAADEMCVASAGGGFHCQ
jgi:hypothetical protein